jgi:hypothetical protein
VLYAALFRRPNGPLAGLTRQALEMAWLDGLRSGLLVGIGAGLFIGLLAGIWLGLAIARHQRSQEDRAP